MSLRLKLFSDTIVFKDQVSQQLGALLGGWRYYKENSFSQYYNPIDFEVHFDGDRPVDLTAKMTHDGDHVTKVAIMVLPSHMITVDTRQSAEWFNLVYFRTERFTVNHTMMRSSFNPRLQGYNPVSISIFSTKKASLGPANFNANIINWSQSTVK